MKEFFILSLRHSPADGNALWWGPDNCGYTTNLNQAGRYTEEQVQAEPLYYNDEVNTIAVPCETVATKVQVLRVVRWKDAKALDAVAELAGGIQ